MISYLSSVAVWSCHKCIVLCQPPCVLSDVNRVYKMCEPIFQMNSFYETKQLLLYLS